MATFLEDYTLIEKLGQGGFATVYKVRHNKLKYIRAVKVLNDTISEGESDPTYKKFLEECKVLLRLGNGNHPNIVHIYQPLLREHKALVEMDYIDGYDLYKLLKDNKNFIDIKDIVELVEQMTNALAYCHHNIYQFCMDRDEDDLEDDPDDGSKVLIDDAKLTELVKKYRVIHNDIHPGNIIRHRDGRYMLLDFGLAIEGNSVVRSSRRRNGAPEYKSPEKWDDDGSLSTQSDVYSMGIVLYHMLAGRVPFPFNPKHGGSIEAEYKLSMAHKKQIPDSIFGLRKSAYEAKYPSETYNEPDYPDWLEELIMKAIAKKPEDRFANGLEMYRFVSRQLELERKNEAELIATGKKSIESLKQDIVIKDRRIEALQLDIEAKMQDIVTLRNEINTLKRAGGTGIEPVDIGPLRNEIERLKQRLTEAQSDAKKWHDKFDSLIDNGYLEGEIVSGGKKGWWHEHKVTIFSVIVGLLIGAVVVFGYGYYKYSASKNSNESSAVHTTAASTSDLIRLKSQVTAKDKELQSVKVELEELKRSKSAADTELEQLKVKINTLEKEKAAQEIIIKKRLSEIEKLNSRLNNEL